MLKKSIPPFADEMRPSAKLGAMNGGCSVCMMHSWLDGVALHVFVCVLKECVFEVCVCV